MRTPQFFSCFLHRFYSYLMQKKSCPIASHITKPNARYIHNIYMPTDNLECIAPTYNLA